MTSLSRVSKLDIFIPSGDCLGSDAVFFPENWQRPMTSLARVKCWTFSSLLGTASGATPLFPRRLAMPNDVTVAGEKFDMFIPPGDCLRSDAVFPIKLAIAQ